MFYVKKSSFKYGMAVETSVRRWKHTDRNMSVKGYKGLNVVFELSAFGTKVLTIPILIPHTQP